MGFFILGVIVLLLAAALFYSVGIYNQLVELSVNVDKSWANIDVLLKQRYDEIPKLIKVCEGYMQYERETLEKITAARTRFMEARTPGQLAQADAQMAGALKTLFAVSENYPDLKANENFRQLQQRVSYLESQIADRREFYNDSVAIFNARIRQIPYVFFAGPLQYTTKEMFKATAEEKQSPDIKFNMPK
jgi:LemA protein